MGAFTTRQSTVFHACRRRQSNRIEAEVRIRTITSVIVLVACPSRILVPGENTSDCRLRHTN